jgi:Domain of unknown function (DUF1906)
MRRRSTWPGLAIAAGIPIITGFTGFTATGVAVAAIPANPAPAKSVPATTAPAKTVTYLGHRFRVPASWPVISLSAHPRDCVRFDVHAIYLGTPGADQDCPASGIAPRTEAVLVQPAGREVRGTGTYRNSAEHEYVATDAAAGLTVTGTYGSAPGVITAILSSAGLLSGPVRAVSVSRAAAAVAASAAVDPVPANATNFTGEGFDPCTAPSSAVMSAWQADSPYGAIGIYIGGSDEACAQPNLTASWVSSQYAAGWRFLPLYAGPQADAGQLTDPASQAVSAADDAATQAASLGLPQGTVIYYDMESFSSSEESAALEFMSGWTTELHADGYKSGLYSSSSTGVSDLVANFDSDAMPDVIDDALWNGDANTTDPVIPAGYWAYHQRVHQFSGGVTQTYGGDSINVDQDYLDVQVSPTGTGFAALFPDTAGALDIGHHADGRVEMFAAAASGAVQNEFETVPNGAWSGLDGFAPAGTAASTATGIHEDGRMEVFAVTPSGGIENKYETVADGAWSGWNDFGPSGTVTSVAVGRHVDDRLEVFAVMSDGSVENKYETTPDGAWSGWNDFAPAGTAASLAIGLHADGRMEVFAVTPAGAVDNDFETTPGGTWSGWEDFAPAGTAASLAIGLHADGRMEVFAVTPSGGIENDFETVADGAWSGWNDFGPGGTVTSIALGWHADGRLEVFAVMSDGSVENDFETVPDGAWSGWNDFGPSGTASSLVVTNHVNGRMEVFAVTPSGGIDNDFETVPDGAWSGWNSFAPTGTVG